MLFLAGLLQDMLNRAALEDHPENTIGPEYGGPSSVRSP